MLRELPAGQGRAVLDHDVAAVGRQRLTQVGAGAVRLSDLGKHGRKVGGDHDVGRTSLLRAAGRSFAPQSNRLRVGFRGLVPPATQEVVGVAEVDPGVVLGKAELERLVVGIDRLLDAPELK